MIPNLLTSSNNPFLYKEKRMYVTIAFTEDKVFLHKIKTYRQAIDSELGEIIE